MTYGLEHLNRKTSQSSESASSWRNYKQISLGDYVTFTDNASSLFRRIILRFPEAFPHPPGRSLAVESVILTHLLNKWQDETTIGMPHFGGFIDLTWTYSMRDVSLSAAVAEEFLWLPAHRPLWWLCVWRLKQKQWHIPVIKRSHMVPRQNFFPLTLLWRASVLEGSWFVLGLWGSYRTAVENFSPSRCTFQLVCFFLRLPMDISCGFGDHRGWLFGYNFNLPKCRLFRLTWHRFDYSAAPGSGVGGMHNRIIRLIWTFLISPLQRTLRSCLTGLGHIVVLFIVLNSVTWRTVSYWIKCIGIVGICVLCTSLSLKM